MDIGLDLFIRRGFVSTKISDIAKQAKMSVGLMFHYFESKEQLYEELIKVGMSGPQMIMSGDHSDPLTFFENAAKQILEYATSESSVAKMFVLMRQAGYNDAAPDSVKAILKSDNTLILSAALIEKGQQDGTLREGNALALALAYWSAIQGVCEALALNPNTPCPASDWIVDIIRRR
ncbi:TetR/AcrR family transcriptional regulator [Cellulosilyticum sp. I15G10I2]|uniref:TetR/AcrR family transcriptional regulator n=1 Tax=Cellulosilyticum sp. I15G10I2 TaxID=1892843 RepID=UPI00085CD356|nr:TetR/AcrR family transcriptional regulator [Cellulosilyticum sp. I15G10I2]